MKLAFVVWLGASALAAQTEPVGKELQARALALLRSERISERAWGAYLCGSLLVGECGEPLVAELEKATSFVAAPDDGEEFFYVQAILDGVIRLGAVVPTSVAMRFDPRWREEVIILLARNPKAEEALLRLGEQGLTTAEWLAVNNQLLRMKSRSFFVRILKQAKIEHFFFVDEAETKGGYLGGYADGVVARNLPLRKVPEGFPPVGIYELRNYAAAGATVLSWGPCYNYGTVNYSRIEIREAGTKVQPQNRSPTLVSIECRNAYLAAFRDIPLDAANEILRPTTRIRWTTAAEFVLQANEAMEANARALQDFIRGARIADLVDPAAFRLTIQPYVYDNRGNKSIPLPDVAPREVALN